jgi:hypothetical protein
VVNKLTDHSNIKTTVEIELGARFKMHDKEVVFDERSLCVFSEKNWIRKACVWLTLWKWFDRVIILVIVFNSVLLGMHDYNDRLLPSDYEP